MPSSSAAEQVSAEQVSDDGEPFSLGLPAGVQEMIGNLFPFETQVMVKSLSFLAASPPTPTWASMDVYHIHHKMLIIPPFPPINMKK